MPYPLRIFLLLLFVFFSFSCFSQTISVGSWNLKNFGHSKSEESIHTIAAVLKTFDIIAIQEVVAGTGGPKAVAKLVDQLNRSGQQWDYSISDPTSGSAYSSERYAFIWKKAKVRKIGEAWLERHYSIQVDREPYYCRFKIKDKVFTLVNYHAIPKARQPETEIKYFKFMPPLYTQDNLIFCGDFNLPQSHSVFNPLRKMGYVSALVKQKTSLKQKCLGDECLASEFDNFYFNPASVRFLSVGILYFYIYFENL